MNFKERLGKLLNLNLLLVVAAIGAGVGGAKGAQAYVNSRVQRAEASIATRFQTRPVVVAARDLSVGDLIRVEGLALRPMPQAYLPSGAVSESRAGELVGRRLTVALRRGDLISAGSVEPTTPNALSGLLPIGKRAVTLMVDETNSLSGLLAAGDQIDLYYSHEKSGPVASLALLLERVPVLATGPALSPASQARPGEVESFGSITLLVSADEAARLVLAQQTGALTVVLRGRGDQQPTQLKVKSSLALIDQGSRPMRGDSGQTIEVFIGGSGELVPERRVLKVGSTLRSSLSAAP
jgi:pilus assembly protein CpaB